MKKRPRYSKVNYYSSWVSLPMFGIYCEGPLEGSFNNNNYLFLLIKTKKPDD